VCLAAGSIGPDLTPVHKQHIAGDQIEPKTHSGALPQDPLEDPFVLAPKLRNSLVVRFQAAHEPDERKIVMGFSFQFSRTLDPIGVTVNKQL
jgi:hypothetical protein